MDHSTAAYLLDEPFLILERQLHAVDLAVAENKISIFHPKGHELGFIREKLTHSYEVYDNSGKLILTGIRPNTGTGPIELKVFGPDGKSLGATYQKIGILKQKYDVCLSDDTKESHGSLCKFGELKGFNGSKVWTVKRTSSGKPLAEISWKHVGIPQFRDPKYYALSFVPMDSSGISTLAERAILLGTALLIDTVHFSDFTRYSRSRAGQDNDGSLVLSTVRATAPVNGTF